MRRGLLVACVLAAACGEGTTLPVDKDDALDDARARGQALFEGRGGCLECHKRGELGDKVRGPDLGAGGPRTAVYIATSIVDPDAVVVEGYAAGVMKPPDEPPRSLSHDDIADVAVFIADDGDLAGARAAIEPALAARAARRAHAQADALVRRVPWHRADPANGARLFGEMGCPLCHDNPHNSHLHAPNLAGVGERLARDDLARWLLAPPRTNMPSYAEAAELTDIADVCEYIRTLTGSPSRDAHQ